MTTSHDRVSAVIYEFPVRGRFAKPSQHNEMAAANVLSSRVAKISYGSGWYHDQAIEEDERSRKN